MGWRWDQPWCRCRARAGSFRPRVLVRTSVLQSLLLPTRSGLLPTRPRLLSAGGVFLLSAGRVFFLPTDGVFIFFLSTGGVLSTRAKLLEFLLPILLRFVEYPARTADGAQAIVALDGPLPSQVILLPQPSLTASMARPRRSPLCSSSRLAASLILALAGCATAAAGSGPAPTAPYQQTEPRDTSGMHWLRTRATAGFAVHLVKVP
jgi:hypothetical protein